MKYKAALGIACVGAVSSGCAHTLDSQPMLAAPALASMPVRNGWPSAAVVLDTVPALNGEPSESLGPNPDQRVQQLAAVHVVASRSPEEAPTPAHISALEPSTVESIRSYRFGEAEPVLTCTVLRACVIELEREEALVDDPIAGDQARWIITTARTGREGASTLVVVKPKACDVTTNLVLSTDRRIYDVDLDSPRCSPHDTNPKRAYNRHIRFTYPNESSAPALGSTQSEPADRASSDVVEPGRSESASLVDSVLNTRYRVVLEPRGPLGLFGRKRSVFPWRPAAIADDGAHVYVSLPEAARKYPSPVLYALEDDGSRAIVNYVVRDTVIITDRVFRRGVLVIPNGKQEQALVFENRAWSASSRGGERR